MDGDIQLEFPEKNKKDNIKNRFGIQHVEVCRASAQFEFFQMEGRLVSTANTI